MRFMNKRLFVAHARQYEKASIPRCCDCREGGLCQTLRFNFDRSSLDTELACRPNQSDIIERLAICGVFMSDLGRIGGQLQKP